MSAAFARTAAPPKRGIMLPSKHNDSIGRRAWAKDRLSRSDSLSCQSLHTRASSKSQRGNRMMRAVAGLLARTKSGKAKRRGSTTTEPTSPVSAQLSRTNSAASSHRTDKSSPGAEENVPARPRVSFDAEVTTVIIEQMNEEEVRNTFYCRTEYAAFKDAYRMHRDTSRDWCRSNDVLPCNCDACQDDLVEGGIGGGGGSVGGGSEDNYDSAFDEPEDSMVSPGGAPELESPLRCDEGASTDPVDEDGEAEPPSPVEAVFQDDIEEEPPADLDDAEPAQASGYRPPARRGSWGGWSATPVATATGNHASHRRGSSLDDDCSVQSSVREAVRCHGAAYAYETLRLQGFSDLYVRTHFLPEAVPPGVSR